MTRPLTTDCSRMDFLSKKSSKNCWNDSRSTLLRSTSRLICSVMLREASFPWSGELGWRKDRREGRSAQSRWMWALGGRVDAVPHPFDGAPRTAHLLAGSADVKQNASGAAFADPAAVPD